MWKRENFFGDFSKYAVYRPKACDSSFWRTPVSDFRSIFFFFAKESNNNPAALDIEIL